MAQLTEAQKLYRTRSPYMEDGTYRCVANRHHDVNEPRCGRPPIKGGRFCMSHGGQLPSIQRQAKLRLADLVDPAISVLGKEMLHADKASDRIKAADSILDRAGISRKVSTPDGEASKALLKEKLLQMRQARLGVQGTGEMESDEPGEPQALTEEADTDELADESMPVDGVDDSGKLPVISVLEELAQSVADKGKGESNGTGEGE